jgi:UDP-glucose 4-epimerase
MRRPPTYVITGGSGFVGSHLAGALVAEGREVRVVDDLSTGRRENIAHLMAAPNFRFEQASVIDESVMARWASEATVVVHLAAVVGVRLVLERPAQTIETNVSGTETVLRAARRYGCRVLIASTSEVYGKNDKVPLREEDDVLLGVNSKTRWAYAASKMVGELLGLAYHHEHGVPVVVARLFNVAGPRQNGDMVLPRFVGQALRGEPITVYGDGEQSRCFCHVEDVVAALAGLAEHPHAAGRIYNVGSTEEVRIRDLAARVKRITGSTSAIVNVPYEEAYAAGYEETVRRVPDITQVRAVLGWRPRRTLDEILDSVAAFEQARVR